MGLIGMIRMHGIATAGVREQKPRASQVETIGEVHVLFSPSAVSLIPTADLGDQVMREADRVAGGALPFIAHDEFGWPLHRLSRPGGWSRAILSAFRSVTPRANDAFIPQNAERFLSPPVLCLNGTEAGPLSESLFFQSQTETGCLEDRPGRLGVRA